MVEFLLVMFFSLLVILIIELGTKPVVTRLGSTNVVFEEFPEINERALSKFSSFDSELGWERQPNETRKKDTGHQRPDNPTANKVVYSTDPYASRVCEISRDTGEYNITTYGDSFCFCREVEDDKTFQHYLSQDLGTHVSNYGVGNYGLDQSLLRMKRRFDRDPAEYIIIALSDAVTVNRIISSWKHFYEFGNTFAIKPRYKEKNDSLEYIPTPINERCDLLELSEYSEYLRENDYHYENWFRQHLMKRPHITYWLQSRYNVPYAASSALEYAIRDIDILDKFHEGAVDLKWHWGEQKKLDVYIDESEYRKQIENEFIDLLCAIFSKFERFAKSKDSVPIFLPIRSSEYYYHESIDPLNDHAINKINSECSNLRIIDPRDNIFESCNDPTELYTSSEVLGGHPSPKHNRLNAEYMANEIRRYHSE